MNDKDIPERIETAADLAAAWRIRDHRYALSAPARAVALGTLKGVRDHRVEEAHRLREPKHRRTALIAEALRWEPPRGAA